MLSSKDGVVHIIADKGLTSFHISDAMHVPCDSSTRRLKRFDLTRIISVTVVNDPGLGSATFARLPNPFANFREKKNLRSVAGKSSTIVRVSQGNYDNREV